MHGGREGGGGGEEEVRKHCCTVWQETKLNHVIIVKTDTLNCNSCPGSIQCEGTSFLASFASSVTQAARKKISEYFQMFLWESNV